MLHLVEYLISEPLAIQSLSQMLRGYHALGHFQIEPDASPGTAVCVHMCVGCKVAMIVQSVKLRAPGHYNWVLITCQHYGSSSLMPMQAHSGRQWAVLSCLFTSRKFTCQGCNCAKSRRHVVYASALRLQRSRRKALRKRAI